MTQFFLVKLFYLFYIKINLVKKKLKKIWDKYLIEILLFIII